ncbi:MAG: MCE family protein [Gammaproteobacteria bacterium]|nr:MCE family protein [Gammaproteobacteria bacterium]MBU1415714.1 MCE family protein [Gammaproteobacteria bacterium]
MSKQANPTLIGAFVLGAIALAVVATLLLGSGTWFGERRQHVLYFDGAAQGLQIGAAVVFLGVKVGTVKEIQLGLDQNQHRFLVPVTIEIEPNVVRASGGETVDLRDRATMQQLIERGLRGQLRMQNLLTGQLYVDLDFHPDKPARYAALDPDLSEIPTIRTTVEELTSTLESFAMDKFLADVASISKALNKLLSSPATQDIPKRLDATLRHLQSLTARLDAQSKPILGDVRRDLVELHKALAGTQSAMARVEVAADRVADLASPDSPMVGNMSKASDELAKAATALQNLAAQDSPTVQNMNATIKEISRAAAAIRKLAETLEEQPDAIYRGKH